MKYYAHFGHNEFILCLGYKATSSRTTSSTTTRRLERLRADGGAVSVELLELDIDDWKITFVDTGHRRHDRRAAEGGRSPSWRRGEVPRQLRRRPHRPAAARRTSITSARADGSPASWRCTRRSRSTSLARPTGPCTAIEPLSESAIWINGGFFVFRARSSTTSSAGEDLVVEPFQRLIAERQLMAYRYDGLLEGDGHVQGRAGARRALRAGRRSRGRSGSAAAAEA